MDTFNKIFIIINLVNGLIAIGILISNEFEVYRLKLVEKEINKLPERKEKEWIGFKINAKNSLCREKSLTRNRRRAWAVILLLIFFALTVLIF